MKTDGGVGVVYNDSRLPGTVALVVTPTSGIHRMTVAEAAKLAEDLRTAVIQSGYVFVAQKRSNR